MTAPHQFPPIEALTLSPEQAALLHLFDRVRALEQAFQHELLRHERAERTLRARADRLKAEIETLKRGRA